MKKYMMEIGDNRWNDIIAKGASELGISVTASQISLLAMHCKELVTWNKISNLTSITDPEEIAIKHVIDSLAASGAIESNSRVIDIGTGGGFPGIPLKIIREDLEIVLLDSSRKKVSFLKQVIIKSGMKSITAIHSRAEDLSEKAGFSSAFDCAVCRAFSSLENIFALASPFLKKEGKIIAMKGKEADSEADDFMAEKNAGIELAIKNYQLPFLHQDRAIISILKK